MLPLLLQGAPSQPFSSSPVLQFGMVAAIVFSVGYLLKQLRPYLPVKTSAQSSGEKPPDYWKAEIRESVKAGVKEALEEVVVPVLEANSQSNRDLATAIDSFGEKLSTFGNSLSILLDRTPRFQAAAGAGASGPQKV